MLPITEYKTMSVKKIVLSLALGGAFAQLAGAHGLWIAQVNGDMTFSYGHSGTDSDAYSGDKIVQAFGFKADGGKADLATKKHENYVTADTKDVAVVAGVMDNGYWAKDKDGQWVNKRGDQVDGAKSSARSLKYTVAYLDDAAKVQPAGLELEIVPDVNPATLKEGDELAVQVQYQGKALEGAKVSSNYFDDHAPTVTTDKDGRATLKVAGHTFNIIAVGHKVEGSDPFEGVSHHSTLTFNAKHDHHH